MQVLILASLWLPEAGAFPVPVLRVPDLAAKADVIVLGSLVPPTEVGTSTVSLENGVQVGARVMAAEIRVQDTLKGPADLSRIVVRYLLTTQWVGYMEPRAGSTALFFLSRDGEGYAFTSPYWPSEPGAPAAPPATLGLLDRLVAYIGAAVKSPDLPLWERSNATVALQEVPGDSSSRELRRLMELGESELRLDAAGALIYRGDLSGLAMVTDALLEPGGTYSQGTVQGLQGALSHHVNDPQAVPALTKLLEQGDTYTRRAAASGLAAIASPAGIGPLVRALDDPDFQVRRSAVTGLAVITHQPAWQPHTADYQEVEGQYVNFWKRWAQQLAPQ